MVQVAELSPQAFESFAQTHEGRFEYYSGEMIALVSNDIASLIAAELLIALGAFVKAHDLGRVTGADGGYVVGENRYIPDLAFVAKTRQARPTGKAYNPIAPDLAVEVISPTDRIPTLMVKVVDFLAAGTIVWVVDPEAREVHVYHPNQPVELLKGDATLKGGALLPHFEIRLSSLFAVLDDLENQSDSE